MRTFNQFVILACGLGLLAYALALLPTALSWGIINVSKTFF